MTLIDRHGEIMMTYAKVHTCDFDPHGACETPGEDFYVCDLDAAAGSLKVGAMTRLPGRSGLTLGSI